MDQSKQIVAIGCDHAGFIRKTAAIEAVQALGFDIMDCGTDSLESVDYPDFAHAVAQAVVSGKAAWGIVLCGSGNGVAITANKYKEIRCALCWKEELGALAHQHNNANVIALPARYISDEETNAIIKAYVQASFEGGRHLQRVEKITACL